MRRGPPGGSDSSWVSHVLPAALYLVLAFISGSLAADPMLGIQFDAKDKLIHLLGFWLMQWTHARALRHLWPGRPEATVLVQSLLSASLAGALLEGWQFFLPHRTADFWDFVADVLGAAIGAGLSAVALRRSWASGDSGP